MLNTEIPCIYIYIYIYIYKRLFQTLGPYVIKNTYYNTTF